MVASGVRHEPWRAPTAQRCSVKNGSTFWWIAGSDGRANRENVLRRIPQSSGSNALGVSFFKAFFDTLQTSPGRALGALYWFLTGRKVRARNRLRMAMARHGEAYPLWIKHFEEGRVDGERARLVIDGWATKPTFSVVLHQREQFDQPCLEALTANLQAQHYERWELLIVPNEDAASLSSEEPRIRIAKPASARGSAALRIAIDLAQGDYLVPISAGTHLPATALFRWAEALQLGPADLLFGDHDEIGTKGQRRRPWFKPEWNDELALAQDYISEAMAVSTAAARSAFDNGAEYDRAATYALGLAVARRSGAVVRHVAHIQAHVSQGQQGSTSARVAVVAAHVASENAEVSEGEHGTTVVTWPLPDRLPLVSIIVPTRDQLPLLRACVESVIDRTTYRPFEIIIVDNGSARADTLAYLQELEKRSMIRIIRDEGPFNFSRLNNVAARTAEGDFLCLLNNDTEIIDGNWLTAMMRQALRSHVGAVGARLLYEDGSIQHAGVCIGLGQAAGHAHRFQKGNAEGYFARCHAAHYASAVTAACLVVAKCKFLSVGGLDEESFAVAFNDVDLCLKLQRSGLRNVYTPHATLMHYESKSRGKDFSPQHIERYRRELGTLQSRWGTRDFVDPLHHVHLDRSSETYLIRL